MSIRLRPKTKKLRTADVVANEALGLELGRLAVADPSFRESLTRGYSLALREEVAGRQPDGDAALVAIKNLTDELAKLHKVRRRKR